MPVPYRPAPGTAALPKINKNVNLNKLNKIFQKKKHFFYMIAIVVGVDENVVHIQDI